ncbi:MAG TPA: EAL domain-containing response regulator [Reyranella sp.]|jgi:EAL domain-containing protein (putative c-di-GMP-specific phosphodiesterase class I)
MPDKFRCLVVCNDDDFREELVERAVSLNFSVRAIRLPGELPGMLQGQGFNWVILDLGLGESTCLQIVDTLGASREPPRTILIGSDDEAALDSVRKSVTRNKLELVGILTRPLSFSAVRELLESPQIKDAESSEPDPIPRQLDAIPNDEIVVHYQPMISMADRTIRRVEALVRWRHPQLGLLRPGRFIAQAERSGAIVPLTWEVVSRAIDQHLAWKNEGLLLAVSVNISALFLESLQRADEILALLQSRSCDPRNLILEITETEAAQNPPIARALLTRLREAGVEVSMDDYGVGFSNLERLRYYPFSDLKVDRWLVAKLDHSREARDIVQTLAALAAKENFSLTGEGIETEQQWNVLEELGCDFGQGFLIARPMPGDRVRRWVDKMTEIGRYRTAAPG